MDNRLDPFYDHLIDAVEANGDHLPDEQYQILATYYRNLKNNRSLRPFYRYNWTQRVKPLVETLGTNSKHDRRLRFLDAGCGTGTESLLCATLYDNVDVVGVDITQERLTTARHRIEAHAQRLGRDMNLSFRSENVFSLLKAEPFDVVWTMEALSHIDPAERFLTAAAESVPSGGFLVISDSHLTNPAMLWRLYKMRGFLPAERTTRTLTEDEIVSYADERLFSVGQLHRMLLDTEWQPIQTQLSIFFPPRLAKHQTFFELATGLDRVLGKTPLLQNLGGIYTVVAQRQ